MVGIASLRICSRLAPTSGPRMVLPVIFPPGRARLGTSPTPTGSPIEIMTMGSGGGLLGCEACGRAEGCNNVHRATNKRRRGFGESLRHSIAICIVEGDVLAFEVTEIAQPVTEGVPVERVVDYADARDLPRLLRSRRERPRRSRAAEKRDELAPCDNA